MPCTLGEEWPIHLPSRVWTRGVERKASVMLAIAHLLCVTRSPDDGAGFGGENDACGAAARVSKISRNFGCPQTSAERQATLNISSMKRLLAPWHARRH